MQNGKCIACFSPDNFCKTLLQPYQLRASHWSFAWKSDISEYFFIAEAHFEEEQNVMSLNSACISSMLVYFK